MGIIRNVFEWHWKGPAVFLGEKLSKQLAGSVVEREMSSARSSVKRLSGRTYAQEQLAKIAKDPVSGEKFNTFIFSGAKRYNVTSVSGASEVYQDYLVYVLGQVKEMEVLPTPSVMPVMPSAKPSTPDPEPTKRELNPCTIMCNLMHGDKAWYDVSGHASKSMCRIACYAIIGGGIILALLLLAFGRKGATKVIVSGAETTKEGAKTAGAVVRKV